MIDSHLHLSEEEKNLENIISRANNVGVKVLVVSGYNYKSSIEAIRLSNKYSSIYATIGLHPSEVSKEDYQEENYFHLAKHSKVIGIGEIGLDYYWDKSNKELQKELFTKQLKLAARLKLPVVIHSRDAMQDTYDILKQQKQKGIMHCYSGSYEMAKLFIKLGFLLGIGGVVTFKNASLREIVRKVSLDNLISETDSPYLSPHPYRGKENFPENIPLIIEEIATLKNTSVDEVKDTFFKNFIKIFSIRESNYEKNK